MILQDGALMIQVQPRRGIVTGSLRRFVAPDSMQPRLLREAHNSIVAGHGGFFKTAERIKELYWWPGMDLDISRHVAECQVCQQTTEKGVPNQQ